MKIAYDDDGHKYWIDGKRCKSVTTVAKLLDDGFGLEAWKQRKIVEGLGMRPDLVKIASDYPGDYSKLSDVAWQAINAARGNEKSERGTKLHALLEAHDTGDTAYQLPGEIDPGYARAVRSAWDRALKDTGLSIEPDYVERIIAYPAQLIAGRFDRYMSLKRSKTLKVVDLKTGKIDYPHSIACQLAMYAHAPVLAGAPDEDGVIEQMLEQPDLDLKTGYIVHMPSPEAIAIHPIDIGAGWVEVEKRIFPMLEWRKRKDLVKPALTTTVIVDPSGPATEERCDWILGRLQNIKDTGDPAAMRMAAARWPNKIAPQPPWSESDIDVIDGRLTTVERDASIPF